MPKHGGMIPGIPDILTTDDFPDPSLQGMVQDGILRRVGNWYCSVAMPDTSGLRAQSIRVDLRDTAIADTYTAAWIYKCCTRLPDPVTGCTHRLARSAAARRLGRIREVTIDDAEIWRVGGQRITTPERTLRDLGRTVPGRGEPEHSLREETRARLVGAALVLMFRLDLDSQRAHVAETGSHPYSIRLGAYIESVHQLIERLRDHPEQRRIAVLTEQQARLPGFRSSPEVRSY